MGWSGVATIGLSPMVFNLSGCKEEYPLEPTFCDDWCRATRKNCDPPANCVSDCELTKSSDDCFELQRDLLECYERDPDVIMCVGEGFGERAVVKDHACRKQRDALFECEAPGIGACLQLCRVTQEEQIKNIAETPVDMPMADEADAGAPSCPSLDDSCEAICWTLFSFNSAGLANAGVTVEDDDRQAPEPGEEFDPDSDAVPDIAECVQMALVGCFAQFGGLAPDVEPPGTGDAQADADESSEPFSIEQVLERCSRDRGE